jgi:DNA-binding transcriptional MerR regulator
MGRQSDAEQSGRDFFSIRVASRLTGISCDTLRMWERRYGYPKPRRNASGVRLYSDKDIERLLLVARALHAGYRAREAIRLPAADLRSRLAASAEARLESTEETSLTAAVLSSLLADDADALRADLQRAVAVLGPEGFVRQLCAPLLREVGDAWASGRLEPRQEHLLATALSAQLRALLFAYDHVATGPVVVLATLPGEAHGLGLDMVALFCALRGARPRLLGVELPAQQIVRAAHALDAKAVGISLSGSIQLEAVKNEIVWIVNELVPPTLLWLGGAGADRLKVRHPRLRIAAEWDQLDQALAESGATV